MDMNTTIDSSTDYLILFLDETEMKKEIVLMDGARCHISNGTQSWLNDNDIYCIPYGGHPIKTPMDIHQIHHTLIQLKIFFHGRIRLHNVNLKMLPN